MPISRENEPEETEYDSDEEMEDGEALYDSILDVVDSMPMGTKLKFKEVLAKRPAWAKLPDDVKNTFRAVMEILLDQGDDDDEEEE